jgi:hypothetical protein
LGSGSHKNELKINGGSKDLYADYSNISVEDAAESNEFYRTSVEEETFTENIYLTLDNMKNNVTENLWKRFCKSTNLFMKSKREDLCF